MTLTVGSLFSGIGGFEAGFLRAGFRTIWQCEIDPVCRRVLGRHFPDTPCYEDVRHLDGSTLAVPDVLVGGFPCQDLSVAGKRAGLAGKRSGLFREFTRLVAELAPRWLLLENVPGLLSSNGGRDMGAVLGALGELGYGWSYRVLDAQFFGVPQRRRRVFIVGCLGDARRAAKVLFEPDGCSWNPPPRRETGARVAAATGGGAPGAGGGVAGPLGSTSNGRGWNDDLDRAGAFIPETAHCLKAEGADASEDGPGGGRPS